MNIKLFHDDAIKLLEFGFLSKSWLQLLIRTISFQFGSSEIHRLSFNHLVGTYPLHLIACKSHCLREPLQSHTNEYHPKIADLSFSFLLFALHAKSIL